MRKPDPMHYPKWLREMICEPFAANIRGVSTNREVDADLRRIHLNYHKDPIATVLFDLVIESIRNRFKIWQMKEKINELQAELNGMNVAIWNLKKELQQVKKRMKKAGIKDVLD